MGICDLPMRITLMATASSATLCCVFGALLRAAFLNVDSSTLDTLRHHGQDCPALQHSLIIVYRSFTGTYRRSNQYNNTRGL
ncbi:hypothetical protein BC830DRAFT_1149143 [Chytriomyces sp. MP71]|nr:hypothetical protein BC830DRAFT_1149143 [Chytriomyces sp. MP71]